MFLKGGRGASFAIMKKVIINHELVIETEAKVSILDRGYQFGDGVYEVIRFYNQKLFKLEEHLRRYRNSAEKIGINFDYDSDKMKEDMIYLMKNSKYNSGYIYTQITRGVAKRDHVYIGKNMKSQYIAYAVQEEDRPFQVMEEGIKVLLHEDIRWLKCDVKSLNLLGSVLVKNKAMELGAKEAILHRDGVVTEGSSTNVFVIKNGALYTHPANHLILDGITKNVVIEIAKENNIQIIEYPFTLEFFKNADEIFTTSSTAEIMPVVKYGEYNNDKYNESLIKDGKKGPLTDYVQGKFGEKIRLSKNGDDD